MIVEIVYKILGIFIIVGLGFIARKTNLIGEDASAGLTAYLFNIATPCMVIATMQEQEFEGEIVKNTFWSFSSYIIATILIGFLSFAVVKLFRENPRDKGIYRMQMAFTNIGFMGIPLTKVIFGGEAELIILLMNIAFIILIYSFGVFLTLYVPGEKAFNKDTAKKMLNLPMVCSLIGLVLFMTGWRLPAVVNTSFGMVSETVVPVSMFIIGIQLSESSIRRIMTRKNLVLSFISLILVPAFCLGLGIILPENDIVTIALTFGMAMPSAAMCAILADQFGRNILLASEGIALTTFFSLFTLPAWAILLTRIFM